MEGGQILTMGMRDGSCQVLYRYAGLFLLVLGEYHA